MPNKSIVTNEHICPFVEKPPDKDCYIKKYGFVNMLCVQEYCGKKFEECAFYQEHVLKE